MSQRIAVAGLVALVLLAGCGGLPTDSDATTDATAGTTAEGAGVIAAPPDDGTTEVTPGTTGTTTRSTTARESTETTVSYNQDVGYEVRASNANASVQYIIVTITPANGSTSVFDDSMRLAPNESREFDFEFPHAGTYEVTVQVGDRTLTRDWEVVARDPDSGLSVYVAPDGEVHVDLEAI